MKKRYWLIGGIIGALTFLGAFVLLWIFSSINMNCLLEPIQSINVGGASCHFKNYFSIGSLLLFGALALLGFLSGIFGALLYGYYERIDNKKPIKIFVVIMAILILMYILRSSL